MRTLKVLLLVTLVGMLAAACAAPTPVVVEKEKVVEKPVVQTVVVEKEKVVEKPVAQTVVVEKEKVVEKVVTATPVPKPTGPRKGGTLNVTFAEWPKNLHAQIDSGTEGLYVQVHITEGLVNIDGNGNIIPGLATEWTMSPDGLTYTFKLRQGVKFHNGTDFDADDVLWTFDRLMGKIEGQQSTQAARFQGAIESVEALDKYTVKIVLKKPWIDFLIMMASDKYMDILSKEAFDELGKDYGLKGAVGTGPFKFKEWVPGDHITIVRNENYWGEPPYLDAIVYRAIPEESTKLISLLTGETDVLLDPPWKDLKDLAKDPNIRIQEIDSGTLVYIGFNTSKPPFDDLRVRQAMAYAIDRQAVMDTVYYGWASKGQGIFPPWHWAWDPNEDFFPYDPEKAKALLAEAGYTEANPLTFEIVTTNETDYVEVATVIQAQLAKIGVNATVNSMDKAAWTAKTWNQNLRANPNFESAVYRLKFGVMTTDFSWRVFHSKTALNQPGYNQPGGYQHPEVDKMLDDAWGIVDQEEATKVYREISRLITLDVPRITLGWPKNINVSHTYVQNLGIFPRDDFPMTYVWLDK